MREAAPYKCDYCLARKGQTNHWHLRAKVPPSMPGLPVTFMLLAWDEKLACELDEKHKHTFEHICSESCAVKALSQELARMSQTPKTAALAVVVEDALAVRDAGVQPREEPFQRAGNLGPLVT